MITLIPKCQTCEDPQICLVYTQCLKHGHVIFEGSDVCRDDFMLSADFVESLLNSSNVNMSDLACGRHDVTCHVKEEDLKRQDRTKDSSTTNKLGTEYQYSHDHHDQWPYINCQDFFCQNDFDWLPSI